MMEIRTRNKIMDILTISLAILMFLGTGLPCSGAGEYGREPAGGRGGDIEPNNDTDNASSISSGEPVNGSLLVTSQNDIADYYLLDEKVPYGKVITAVLYHVDFDDSNVSRINFNVGISCNWSGYPYTVNYLNSTNRTETAVWLQQLNLEAPADIYIGVYQHWESTGGGNYSLTVTVSDPPQLPIGEATGYLNNVTGPLTAYYKINDLAPDAGLRLKLYCPAKAAFMLIANSILPILNTPWPQGASLDYTPGCVQTVHLVGLGGTYYISVGSFNWYYNMLGNGTYRLVTDRYGGPQDNDNSPSKATPITTNSVYDGNVASGIDTVDWWRVDMKPGQVLELACMTYNGSSNEDGYFNFSTFDKDLRYIDGNFTANATPPVKFQGLTTNYTGPLYFAVTAGYPSSWYPYLGRGSYKLEFRLPNDPPRVNGTLPNIVMDEDTSDNSLVLSEHVLDPDGQHINYTYSGTNYNTVPVVDRNTGRVNFTPKKHWYGTEMVKFKAQDDGPGQKYTIMTVNVTVNSVNDAPAAAKSPDNVTINEETTWETPDLATVFTDVEDPPSNFTYGCRVVSSDTKPPGGTLPARYNSKTRSFTIGPAHLCFGNFEVELNCTDNQPGTVPGATRFNITVTHINHNPILRENVSTPLPISIQERGNSPELSLDDLFTDPDLPKEYAADSLTYSVSGMDKLSASINAARKLVVGAGTVQYKAGFPGMETLTVTAKDKGGLNTTLDFLVTVEPIDDPPEILSVQPVGTQIKMKEGEKKIFSVAASDPDTDTHDLTYKWYVDGVLVPSARGTSFSYEPDFTMGGVEHKLRVDVRDASNTVPNEWPVLVADVNRLPSGSISSPLNSTSFKKGEAITFAANATDLDGDTLTFTWTDRSGTVIGRGTTFTYGKLPKGAQLVRLDVNDTKGDVYYEVIITIKDTPAPKKTPGFELLGLLAAVGLSLVLSIFLRKGNNTIRKRER